MARLRSVLVLSIALCAVLGTVLSLSQDVVAQDAGAQDAVAQDAAQSATAQGFIDTVDVNVVNIDVVVSDRRGRSVGGLTLDDFEVYEDGRKVDLRYFAEIREGAATDLGDAAPLATVDETSRSVALETVEGAPSAGAERAEPRYLVFLFDQQSLQGPNRKRFLDAVDEFVDDELRVDDQVLVAVASRGLAVVQGFTDQRAELRAAHDRVGDLAAGGTMRDVAQRNLVLDLAQVSFGGSIDSAIDPARVDALSRVYGAQIEGEARSLYLQTIDSLGALAVMVDSLAGIPGRKALVHVSEGLPMRPGESLFVAFSNKFNRFSDDTMAQAPQVEALAYDLSKEFSSVLELAQDADVAIYAVDAGGRRADLRASASYKPSDIFTQDSAGGQDVWNSSIQLQEERNRREGPELFAKGSGGDILVGTRKYDDFLSRVANDLGNYYSLGYQPERARSGELHAIEVRLRPSAERKGVDPDKATLRYRQSYRNRTWLQTLEDMARASLRIGVVGDSANDMDLALQVGDLEMRDDGTYIAPLAVVVPAGSLTLVPMDAGLRGQLEAVLVIRDEDGNLSPGTQIPVSAQFEGAELPEGARLLVGAVSVALEEGPKELAVALRDSVSGRSAVATLGVGGAMP
ncbi:MAG: VWA domain-containing protein [Acidobacteriota bacterium]